MDRVDAGDRTLTCCECGAAFTWTVGEQRYFAAKQLTQPKRCPPCRNRKRLSFDIREARGGADPELSAKEYERPTRR